MRLSAMGDVAMTVPVIQALTQQHPNVKVTVVSRPFFQPLFEGIPNVEFFPFEENSRHNGFLGLFRLFSDLKAMKIDAFADLHNVLRSKIVRTLFLLNGYKVAYTDKGRAEKKVLTRLENKVLQQLPTVFDRHVNVFKALGFPIDLSRYEPIVVSNLDEKVQAIIGDDNKILIGIAHFAQYDTKVYPLDLMRQVVQELSKNDKCKLLFFGSPQEVKSMQMLTENINNAFIVAEQLTFRQELQLISRLQLMLSMDSGNAHLAAIFGIKTVTLWGATHPAVGFAPFRQPIGNCLTADRTKFPFLPTSVYGKKKVEGYEDAMRTITVESVVQKVDELLKQ
jgi:ADP-heptose:LPS heptosyltransferase